MRFNWPRGYLKKLVIADRAAVAVNTVFDNPSGYGGAMTALAVGFYCIQLLRLFRHHITGASRRC